MQRHACLLQNLLYPKMHDLQNWYALRVILQLVQRITAVGNNGVDALQAQRRRERHQG